MALIGLYGEVTYCSYLELRQKAGIWDVSHSGSASIGIDLYPSVIAMLEVRFRY